MQFCSTEKLHFLFNSVRLYLLYFLTLAWKDATGTVIQTQIPAVDDMENLEDSLRQTSRAAQQDISRPSFLSAVFARRQTRGGRRCCSARRWACIRGGRGFAWLWLIPSDTNVCGIILRWFTDLLLLTFRDFGRRTNCGYRAPAQRRGGAHA